MASPKYPEPLAPLLDAHSVEVSAAERAEELIAKHHEVLLIGAEEDVRVLHARWVPSSLLSYGTAARCAREVDRRTLEGFPDLLREAGGFPEPRHAGPSGAYPQSPANNNDTAALSSAAPPSSSSAAAPQKIVAETHVTCILPLTWEQASLFADYVVHRSQIFPESLEQLQALAALGAYSSEEAGLLLRECLAEVDEAIIQRGQARKKLVRAPGRRVLRRYPEGQKRPEARFFPPPEEEEETVALSRAIRSYARREKSIAPLEDQRDDLGHSMFRFAEIAIEHNDLQTAGQWIENLFTMPQTTEYALQRFDFKICLPPPPLRHDDSPEKGETTIQSGKKDSDPEDGQKTSDSDSASDSAPVQIDLRPWSHSVLKALERLAIRERAEVSKATNVGSTQEIGSSLPIPLDAPYVFTLARARELRGPSCDNYLLSPQKARDRLQEFVGGYLDLLDLSDCFITGSAMAAVLSSVGEDLPLNSYYPPLVTRFADDKPAGGKPTDGSPDEDEKRGEDRERYNRLIERSWRTLQAEVKVVSEDSGAILAKLSALPPPKVLGNRVVPASETTVDFALRTERGTDVDIAVNCFGDLGILDAVAHRHFEAVRKVHPDVRLICEERLDGQRTWRIEPESLARRAVVRALEIYPANFAHIASHHLGPVRAAYTAVDSPESKPRFVMTASCVWSHLKRRSLDYYYFASRKTLPQEIILKYRTRGFQEPQDMPNRLADRILSWGRYDAPEWKVWSKTCTVVYDWRHRSPALTMHRYASIFSLPADLRRARGEDDPPANSSRSPLPAKSPKGIPSAPHETSDSERDFASESGSDCSSASSALESASDYSGVD